MKRSVRILIIGALAVLVVVLLVFVVPEKATDLREMIDGAGAWGPLLVVLLQASRPVSWVPGTVLTPAAGYLFGFWQGLLLSWTGMMLAVGLGYVIPRLIGVDRCREIVERRAPGFLRRAEQHSGKTVFLARLVPGIPANLVSYAAGTVRYPVPRYLGGSAVGVLPRLILQTLIGTGLYALGGG